MGGGRCSRLGGLPQIPLPACLLHPSVCRRWVIEAQFSKAPAQLESSRQREQRLDTEKALQPMSRKGDLSQHLPEPAIAEQRGTYTPPLGPRLKPGFPLLGSPCGQGPPNLGTHSLGRKASGPTSPHPPPPHASPSHNFPLWSALFTTKSSAPRGQCPPPTFFPLHLPLKTHHLSADSQGEQSSPQVLICMYSHNC